MRKFVYQTDEATFVVFMSRQTWQEKLEYAAGEYFNETVGDSIESLIVDRLSEDLWEFMKAYAVVHKKSIAVLDAHGFRREDGVWCYMDGASSKPVQSWVNSKDASYAALVTCVCDEYTLSTDARVSSKHSLLLLPDGPVFTDPDPSMERHHWQLWHPTYGEVDAYQVEHAWKQLISPKG